MDNEQVFSGRLLNTTNFQKAWQDRPISYPHAPPIPQPKN